MDTIDAMFHAAAQRMRPMLMTALSACIGLLPAAISTGIGSQVQRPLATVVVGGMFIGPIILLVVVPALQTLSFWIRQRGVPEDRRPAGSQPPLSREPVPDRRKRGPIELFRGIPCPARSDGYPTCRLLATGSASAGA